MTEFYFVTLVIIVFLPAYLLKLLLPFLTNFLRFYPTRNTSRRYVVSLQKSNKNQTIQKIYARKFGQAICHPKSRSSS